MSSMLKGLTDRKLAGQVCNTDEVDTLAAASKVALAKESKCEKREQMIDHEPMELGSAHQDKDAADKFLSIMDTMQRRMEQMQTRLQQTESRLREPPTASPPPQDQQSTQPDRTQQRNWRPAPRDRRNTRSHRRHQDKDAADKFLSIMDTMQGRMEQMQTRLQQTESCLREPPTASPPPQDQQSTQPDRTQHRNWRPAPRDRRNTRNHRRQAQATPHWTVEGEPPCLWCHCSKPTHPDTQPSSELPYGFGGPVVAALTLC